MRQRAARNCGLPVARLPGKLAVVHVKTETQNVRHTRRQWIILIALSALILGIAFLADASVAAWINAHTSVGLERAMRLVSKVGDWPAHVIAGLVLMGIAWMRKAQWWVRIFLAMLIACALAGAAARVVKIASGRPRPSVKTEMAWHGPSLGSKYNAFPSGHTASSAAFFVVLFLAKKKIGAPLLAIPALIGTSRMFVAAHYLSDVAGGVVVGVLTGVLVYERMQIDNRQSKIEN
jgi:membrane-associated phospholipid phosphatase